MDNRCKLAAWMFVGLVICNDSGSVLGQTYERDTTITGPRGRSIKRQVELQRTPGGVDRTVQITRPGGTIERQTQIQRVAPGWGPLRGGPGPGGWGRPPWLPRPVVVNPGPAIGLGLLTAPVLNFSFGGGGGGFGVGGGMGPGGPGGPGVGPAQPPPPPDTVALEAERLKSFFWSARKDAAYNLGRAGDPRAIPSLIHVLKYDSSRDVRVAAAIAMGEIGGSEAAVALEKCAIYDHKEEVRTAATSALNRLNTKLAAAAANSPPASSAAPFRADSGSRGTAGADSGPTAAMEPAGSFTPPPPPSPVTSGASGGSR